MKNFKIDVFGKKIQAIFSDNWWIIYYLSSDCKRRLANDIIVPSFIKESEIENYLADLCHEWATDKYPEVRIIK